MNLSNLEVHELATHLPPISEREMEQLTASIKEVGLKQPLMLYESKILDGRHRYEACQRAGWKLRAQDVQIFEEECEGQSPIEYVIALNLKRRHLTVGQRDTLLEELIALIPKAKPGKPVASELRQIKSEISEFENDRTKTEQAERIVKEAGGTMDGVQTASRLKKVAPELHEEVKQGRMSMNKAKQEARKKTKPKPTPDEHDLAWERIKEVCEQQFVDKIREDQVPGLKPVEQLIAFSKLGDKEMKELRQPLYRAHLSLAHARKVLDRRDPATKVLRPDWTWTHQETISLMAGDEKQILKRVLETDVGTFVVVLARVKPGKEDIKVERVPITEQKKENGEDQ